MAFCHDLHHTKTVAKFRRILPAFCEKGFADLRPLPDIGCSEKNNWEKVQGKGSNDTLDRMALQWKKLFRNPEESDYLSLIERLYTLSKMIGPK